MSVGTPPVYAGESAAWPEHVIGQPLKWAEIDVGRLRANAAAVRAFVDSKTAVMAMIKANGYGHGALLAARAALAGGADWLGVSSPGEALQLRESGLDVPVLIVGWSPPTTHLALIQADIDITVDTADAVEALAAAAAEAGTPARIHVKIDSGMNRLGARPESLPAVVAALHEHHRWLDLTGIFTHFADADGADPEFTEAQHERFVELAAPLRDLAPAAALHCSNSAATLRFPAFHHDMVRPGLVLYGYLPDNCGQPVSVQPAMTVAACVINVKTVPVGEAVGYGCTWRARRPTRVATFAAGYADGLLRAQSNRGVVLIGGVRCPIVGRVSMDQTTVDVTDAGTVRPGDEAILVGASNGEWLGADEVGAAAGTVGYEVLCDVSARVPRIVVGDR